MRIRLLLIRKFFFVILLVIGAGNTLRAQTISAQRIETFEEVWKTINDYYYDARFNGVNWLKVKKLYRTRLEKASDDKTFYALLDRMAGELRDSHTRVYSPDQSLQRQKRQTAGVGIQVKRIKNDFIIVAVKPDSEAARDGIKAGMTILAINNQPIKNAYADARRQIGASSSKIATEMRAISKLLKGEPNTELPIDVKSSIGEKFSVKLRRRVVTVEPQIVAHVLDSGIGYLKISEFEESIEKQFAAALEQIKNTKALILDLRDNGGGDGEVGLRIAGHFIKDKITIARLVTRTGKPPVEGMPLTLEIGEQNSRKFNSPLVILINERTASTAELIANALQEQQRAVIFGTNSCGCVLGFLDYKKLKNGGDLTMSEFGFVTANGKTLEGKGVKPNKIVEQTVKNIQINRDAAFLEAEQYLLKLN